MRQNGQKTVSKEARNMAKEMRNTKLSRARGKHKWEVGIQAHRTEGGARKRSKSVVSTYSSPIMWHLDEYCSSSGLEVFDFWFGGEEL